MRIILIGRVELQLAQELTGLGHEILTARNADDVLAIVAFFSPDLIWLEEPTPGTTAEKLAFLLRRDDRLERAVIVKHSESSWEVDRLSHGPFDLCMTRESLLECCRNVL